MTQQSDQRIIRHPSPRDSEMRWQQQRHAVLSKHLAEVARTAVTIGRAMQVLEHA